jgi:hypothetical protein
MTTFGGWLRTHLINNNIIGDQLYLLVGSPSSIVLTFQGYEINGNTFYTIAQDKKSTNKNSGICIDATNNNGQKDTYYGYIEEIWELDLLAAGDLLLDISSRADVLAYYFIFTSNTILFPLKTKLAKPLLGSSTN